MILDEHSHNTVVVFAADFKHQIGFMEKLTPVAELVERTVGDVHWQATGTKFLIREKPAGLLVIADHTRLFFQMQGLRDWKNRLSRNSDLFKACLDRYAVNQLTRVGFKIQAWIDLGMSHEELVSLFLGTFLSAREQLAPIFGELEDTLVQIEGRRDGVKSVVIAAPMTGEQAAQSLLAIPTLRVTFDDPLLDTSMIEFRERVARDTLFFDIDLSKQDLTTIEGKQFMKDACDLADKLADDYVRILKSLPVT